MPTFPNVAPATPVGGDAHTQAGVATAGIINADVTLTDTTLTTLVAAPANANLLTFLNLFVISNAGSNFVVLTVSGGGTSFHIPCPPTSGAVVPFPICNPYKGVAGTAIKVQLSGSPGGSVFVSAAGYQGT